MRGIVVVVRARCPEVIGFFFQAEGGIRYLTVTGVQTCALPIWRPRARARFRALRPAPARGDPRPRARAPYAHPRSVARPLHADGRPVGAAAREPAADDHEDRKSVV